jgi:hypothetical protein
MRGMQRITPIVPRAEASPRAAQKVVFLLLWRRFNAPRAISRTLCIRVIRVPPLNLDGRMATLDPQRALIPS